MATLLSSISTVIAAGVAGWFAYLARRASTHGPESVAGGYSRLVTDMRVQQEALMARVAKLEQERSGDREQIRLLMRQVEWLMAHLPQEHRERFNALFGEIADNK